MPATHREEVNSRGYRQPDGNAYCDPCAELARKKGFQLVPQPRAQEPDEELVWLAVCDDHEFVAVSAATAEEAGDHAREQKSDQYGDEYEGSADVVAGFRGESNSDELEWVPDTGDDENRAYRQLDYANL